MKEQGSGIDVDMFPFPQEAFPRTSKCLLLGGERLKGQGLKNVSYLFEIGSFTTDFLFL